MKQNYLPKKSKAKSTFVSLIICVMLCVQTYSSNAVAQCEFELIGTETISSVTPYGLTTDDSYYYITNADGHRIQKYELDGTLLWSVGSFGSGPDQFKFNSPEGIEYNDGKLYVADNGNNRIAVYDTDGVFIQYFTHPDLIQPRGTYFHDGRLYVATWSGPLILVFNTDGSLHKSYSMPLWPVQDMAVYNNKMYVCARHNIQVYDLDGVLITEWLSVGNYPQGIEILDDDNVVITDHNNGRVLVYEISGVMRYELPGYNWSITLRGQLLNWFHYSNIETYALCGEILGCTDPNAHNYNPSANVDDGSCETCTDGLLNGDELGVDCGGTLCDPCNTYYADSDGDGYGDPTTSILALSAPAGFVENDQDCDDGYNQTYPGAPELCDGLDNDCDGIVPPMENDMDGDGVCSNVDNCPSVPNPGQEDVDGDALGDACDDCPFDPENDSDADGVCGDVDNCPDDANADQADLDDDGIGDVCDDMLQMEGAVETITDSINGTQATGKNGLINKLDQAMEKCQNGQQNAAINQLNAFIDQVEEKRGVSLTNEEADYLVSSAQAIIDAINDGNIDCTPPPVKSPVTKIFPNPNSGHFTISVKQPDGLTTQCTLFDTNGRVLASRELEATDGENNWNSRIKLDIPGMYFFSTRTMKEVKTYKIVVTGDVPAYNF